MKLHQQLAGLFAYKFIAKHKLTSALEVHLLEVFRRAAIDCVIDVGANCGQYGQMLRSAGYRGRIVSFEPSPQPFAELSQRSSADPNWLAVPLALCSRDGKMLLNRASASAFYSFHSPNAYGAERFSTVIDTIDREHVDMTSLLKCWPRFIDAAHQEAIFPKLDTQGYDLEVIVGAAEKIDASAAIQAEIAFQSIYENAPDHIESLTRYRDLGFEVSRFRGFEVSRFRVYIR